MIEYRTVELEPLEEKDNNRMRLRGYAARFNTPSLPITVRGKTIREIVDPRAFDESLNDPDISLYFQHDASEPLASTLSGSLNMRTDDAGLLFEATLPDTQLARDAMALVRAKIVRQMSFGFVVREDKYEGDTRTLLNVDLSEISLVERAAYPETEVVERSKCSVNNKIALKKLRLANWRKL